MTTSETNQETSSNINVPIAAPVLPLDAVSQELLASDVMAKLMPEYQALTPQELLHVNLDIQSAVSMVLGALPRIRALRATVLAAMPSFDIALFDKLEDYAIGLNDAHGDYMIATEASSELQALLTEATQLRETLLADATALVHRGLVDGKSLAELNGPVGYKNLALDLNMLRKVLHASWAQIVGKSSVTEVEINRAARLQLRLIRLVGQKDQGAPSVAAVSDIRQRAYTLFLHCYDHVRRAAGFIRWNEGDADSIAPSLYAGRQGKRKGSDVATPDTHAATAPGSVNPGAANGTAGAAAGGTSAGGTAGASSGAGVTAHAATANGVSAPTPTLHIPGGDPFFS